MLDPAVEEVSNTLNSCNVVLIQPNSSTKSTEQHKMCNTDKLRLNFLESELRRCTSKLFTYEKSTSFILAQLQLINNWIEFTFGFYMRMRILYFNNTLEASLIDTKSTAYQNWIQSCNINKIKSIAQQIKYRPSEKVRRNNINPQRSSKDSSASIIEKNEAHGFSINKTELQQHMIQQKQSTHMIQDQECQDDYFDLPLINVDPIIDDDEAEGEECEHDPNTFKKVGRKRSSYWKYFITTKHPENKNKIISATCKGCGKEVSPQAQRLPQHLATCTSLQHLKGGIFDKGSTESKQFATVSAAPNSSIIQGKEPQESSRIAKRTKFSNQSSEARSNYTIMNEGDEGNVNLQQMGSEDDSDSVNNDEPLIFIKNEPQDFTAEDEMNQNQDPSAVTAVRVNYVGSLEAVDEDGDEWEQDPDTSKAGRKRSSYWKYFIITKHPQNSNKIIATTCKACGEKVSPQAQRLPKHLAKCTASKKNQNESTTEGKESEEFCLVQPKINKAAKKAQLTSYFITNPRDSHEFEASAESNVKQDLTISTCRKCGKNVRSGTTSMINHLKRCDPMVGEEFNELLRRRVLTGAQCEECGKIVTKDNLSTHMLVHSELRSSVCGTCGKSFRRKSTLKLHILTVHKGVKIPRAKRQRQITASKTTTTEDKDKNL